MRRLVGRGHRAGLRALRWIAGVGLLAASASGVKAERPAKAEQPGSGPTVAGCRIEWASPITDAPLSAGVRLGGLSDLASDRARDSQLFWAVTDRGPNGTHERRGTKLRTLLAPDFSPTLVLLRIPRIGSGADAGPTAVERVLPLSTPQGHPLTGLPTGGPGNVPVLAADGAAELSPDPDGVDSEGVVHLADGTFWIVEEYGPSLLKVGPEGRAIERHVPVGCGDSAAVVPRRETIPAAYARRRDNRGFEAIAAAPDGTRIWMLLQSPLDNPEANAARKTGNVRLLGFDPAAGRAVAEHVYRLGDPSDPAYLTKAAPPEDGKLCAMAMIDDGDVLVLEQDDAGLARLYAVSLAGATDTLDWQPPNGKRKTLEQIRDLPEAGIVPLVKRLVADLGPLRDVMTAQADGGEARHGPLKLEGLAIVDDRHLLIANDDDFGVHGKNDGRRRSFLWLVKLDRPLVAGPPR